MKEFKKAGDKVTIEDVYESCRRYITNEDDMKLIKKAYDYIMVKHEGQKRKSGEPYTIHLIWVAYILSTLQTGPLTITAGLLHDVMEDCDVSREEMVKEFGEEVTTLVEGVTKISKMPFKDEADVYAENHRKIYIAMAKDIRVILIKFADRLHNMRTLQFMPPEKQKRISRETLEVYTPIAHRLGLSDIKTELEDLSLSYLDPIAYHDIARLLQTKQDERKESVAKMMEEVENLLKENHYQYRILGRAKSIYSIYKKMFKKHKRFDELYDLYALRIILQNKLDCYSVLGLIHDHYRPIPGRFKDYIAMPKPNMYQSLHTSVIGEDGNTFEIQIRTEEMDELAELGVAAHWRYKEGKGYSAKAEQKEIGEKLQWLREFISLSDDIKDGDAKEYYDSISRDIFEANVYVLTPQGKIVELPNGSTPVDFAYRIHTNLGHKTTGAIVNGKIVTLNYQLKTGDIVEIKSSRNSFGPSEDWLNIVKTSQARHKIRQYFNRTKREEYTHKGEEMFLKELASKDLSLSSIDMQKLLGAYKKQSIEKLDELYYQIGRGRLVAKTILERYFADGKEVDDTELIQQINDAAKIKEEHRKKAKNRFGIIVDGLDNVDLRIGKCCNPVPGDPIVGYITKGSGITIHHAECHNAKIDGRIVPVEWDDEHSNSFNAKIKVTALDRKNVLGDIIQKLTVINANITELNALTSNDTIIINLSLSVRNIDQLVSVVNTIKRVKDVFSVERIIQ